MSNQSGSAFWTCAVCGAMGSALDSSCPNCGATRGTTTPSSTLPSAQAGQPAIPVVQGSVTAPQAATSAVSSWRSPACRTCGTTNSWLNATCSSCGAPLSMVPANRTPRQRVVAAILAFFGGVVGAQYFYMGRYAAGVVCVALCWTGYSVALGFIDGIRLLT
ncbi:MAG: TM2 domain-containing protein, partial [Roseiflexaceae bacterium]